MIRFPISYKRDKGPKTPNFRKLSVMLRSETPTKIPIDSKNITLKHGVVGIKMIFVCDIIEELQRLNSELKAWLDEGIVYIGKREFYDFIFNLDIFIFELYSIFDYFALEIGETLKLKKKTKRGMVNIEYFTDLKKAKGFSRNTLAIKRKAKNVESQPWFKYFHDMRNRIVHRLPISLRALVYGETFEFPFFPDDPLNPDSLSEKKSRISDSDSSSFIKFGLS